MFNRYKDAKIVAVDLSLSSLGYAQRKSIELGMTNIEYIHGDILELNRLGREFDLIESTGVLHHLEDPLHGWEILSNCLIEGGLMKIGLYSKLARRDITKTRSELSQSTLDITKKDLISFRESLINSELSHHQSLLRSSDFYSLSSFRDLILHVQETQFTIPQIRNALSELGLAFCGFEFSAMNYHHSGDLSSPILSSLDLWETFETVNPDTFSEMYQFWCQRI